MFSPFSGMTDKGLLFAYTEPISALIHLCYRKPEETAAALAQVEAFSRHFVQADGE